MPTPGPLELVIILVIALIILGPGKLPDVGASLGKSIREFRKASSDIQEAATIHVDTTPLPPQVAAQPPIAAAAPYVQAAPADIPVAPAVVDQSDRIAELERQLAEARAKTAAESPAMPASSQSHGAGTSASA
jgi:sec-independent protein translocase protein TatA